MNKVIKELAVLLLLASGMANAGLITIGGLTLENAGDSYVTDHVNNVDYLRWDQVKDLSYSELTTALQTGNAYDGWEIASNGEANDFVNALLDGTSSCDEVTGTSYCSMDINFRAFELMMGISYDSVTNLNFAFFLSDNGIYYEVGYVQRYNDMILKINEWDSIAESDNYSASGQNPESPIGFLLYRDNTEVPEPSTLAIFALGMIGLASRRFKKK
jgi:hypothetical protein